MGTWGTGIYQNDVSLDVKDAYMMKLKSGKSDEKALQEILEEMKIESEDDDCKYDFIFALADTLWKSGRLTEDIKNKALQMIEEDKLSGRWHPEKIRKNRVKILDNLKMKIESQMPMRKKISVHKPYSLGWNDGDVYYFQIKNKVENYEEYVDWYVLLYVDKIKKKDWIVKGVYDEVAEVYFFMTKEKPKDVNEIKSATPICFLEFNEKKQYGAYLFEKSKRQRPKDLTFLGNYTSFVCPHNNFSEKMHFFWILYERDILWGYAKQVQSEGKL